MRPLASSTVVLAVVLSLVGTTTHATTITLQPSSQDAYITQDRPNKIAGASPRNTRIRIMSSTPNPRIQRGLVQFNLSTIPAAATINSAIASLYEGNNPGVTRTHGLHRVTAAWLQSAVKWNNQPPHVASASATASVGTSTGFKAFDVTADVQVAVNLCAADRGWMVKDQAETTGNVSVNYIAKEEDAIPDQPNRPKLTVDFTAPPCSTNADCADANPCSINERCDGGFCLVDPLDCDDADPCTDDICDCQQGCINPPICNDGFSCTIDTCDPDTLECTNTPVDAACDSGGCGIGECVADPDSSSVDPDTGCEFTPTQPDGTPCVSDSNQCTDDACLAGQCTHPNSTNGTSCGDGSACTLGDQCDGAGVCVPGGPVVCTPLGQCYDAGTCDTQTGLCSNPPKSSGSGCDDGDLCMQTDECDGAGTCVGSNPVICTALDQCHDVGTCDSGTGVCSNPIKSNGTGCDDGNTCTLDDACAGGMCLGDPMTCGDNVVQGSCAEECDEGPTGGGDCDAQCRYICGPVPRTGCRQPALPGKGIFLLKDKTPDKRDVLLWKWVKGSETPPAAFGDPLTTTN